MDSLFQKNTELANKDTELANKNAKIAEAMEKYKNKEYADICEKAIKALTSHCQKMYTIKQIPEYITSLRSAVLHIKNWCISSKSKFPEKSFEDIIALKEKHSIGSPNWKKFLKTIIEPYEKLIAKKSEPTILFPINQQHLEEDPVVIADQNTLADMDSTISEIKTIHNITEDDILKMASKNITKVIDLLDSRIYAIEHPKNPRDLNNPEKVTSLNKQCTAFKKIKYRLFLIKLNHSLEEWQAVAQTAAEDKIVEKAMNKYLKRLLPEDSSGSTVSGSLSLSPDINAQPVLLPEATKETNAQPVLSLETAQEADDQPVLLPEAIQETNAQPVLSLEMTQETDDQSIRSLEMTQETDDQSIRSLEMAQEADDQSIRSLEMTQETNAQSIRSLETAQEVDSSASSAESDPDLNDKRKISQSRRRSYSRKRTKSLEFSGPMVEFAHEERQAEKSDSDHSDMICSSNDEQEQEREEILEEEYVLPSEPAPLELSQFRELINRSPDVWTNEEISGIIGFLKPELANLDLGDHENKLSKIFFLKAYSASQSRHQAITNFAINTWKELSKEVHHITLDDLKNQIPVLEERYFYNKLVGKYKRIKGPMDENTKKELFEQLKAVTKEVQKLIQTMLPKKMREITSQQLNEEKEKESKQAILNIGLELYDLMIYIQFEHKDAAISAFKALIQEYEQNSTIKYIRDFSENKYFRKIQKIKNTWDQWSSELMDQWKKTKERITGSSSRPPQLPSEGSSHSTEAEDKLEVIEVNETLLLSLDSLTMSGVIHKIRFKKAPRTLVEEKDINHFKETIKKAMDSIAEARDQINHLKSTHQESQQSREAHLTQALASWEAFETLVQENPKLLRGYWHDILRSSSLVKKGKMILKPLKS